MKNTIVSGKADKAEKTMVIATKTLHRKVRVIIALALVRPILVALNTPKRIGDRVSVHILFSFYYKDNSLA